MNKKRTLVLVTCMTMVLFTACSATGDQSNSGSMAQSGSSQQMNRRGFVFGQIASINGNTLTVQGRNNQTYTVDATSAMVNVNDQPSTLSSLSVGDQIVVRGNPSGQDPTQITAQTIRKGGRFGMGRRYDTQQTQQMQETQQLSQQSK